jgi:hypothetical protein
MRIKSIAFAGERVENRETLKTMKTRLPSAFLFTLLLTFSLAAARLAQAAPDFGNYSSADLTTNAWKAYGDGRYSDAVALTSKCIESFKSQAGEQQRALKSGHTQTNSWALNDVGTCYYIRGMSYGKMGKTDKATEDYQYLIKNLDLAEAQGDKGVKWKPASAAKDSLGKLMVDATMGSTISKIDMSSITVGGKTYKTTMSTRVTINGSSASISDLKTGMNAAVTTGADPMTADSISVTK